MLRTLRIAAGIALVLASSSSIASAQTTGVERAERLPVVTFGAGTGPLGNGELATSIVVQAFLSRRLVLEVDRLFWERNEARVGSSTPYGTQTFHRHRSGSVGGASLLFRTPPRRVSWFVGGGMAFLETFDHDRYVIEDCVPTAADPRRCDNLSFTTNKFSSQQVVPRALTGADVRIAGPLSAYGLFEITGSEGYLRLSGGVRVTALSRDAARIADAPLRRLDDTGANPVPVDQARGKRVRMLFVSGSERTAVLMDLTATDVAVRESGSAAIVRYPLEQLRLVKIVRNTSLKAGLIGLGVGAGTGCVLAVSYGGDAVNCMAAASLVGAIGGAGSALIAALVTRSQAASNVVWLEKKRSASVAPIVTPTTLGVGGAIKW